MLNSLHRYSCNAYISAHALSLWLLLNRQAGFVLIPPSTIPVLVTVAFTLSRPCTHAHFSNPRILHARFHSWNTKSAFCAPFYCLRTSPSTSLFTRAAGHAQNLILQRKNILTYSVGFTCLSVLGALLPLFTIRPLERFRLHYHALGISFILCAILTLP